MEFDDIVLTMNLLGTDEKTGKLLCPIKVELGDGPGGLAMRAESANLWHRRTGAQDKSTARAWIPVENAGQWSRLQRRHTGV